MKKYILAIDQGTTSTRAILFDRNQKIVKVAQREIKNFFPHPGWVEQDANEIWLSTLSVMAELFSDGTATPDEVISIGITNQRETTVMWDKNTGLPVYHAIVWQSRQTSEIIERYKAMEDVEETVKKKTGLLLDPYFSASKIRWIYENVEAAKDNHNLLFGTIDTWLLWKMTNGKVHATDVTNASRTLLFNIHTLQWDFDLLRVFKVPASVLPKIHNTSENYGMIDPVHFFNCSVPICALVGDQQAALFGQSCFEKGESKNTYGTGGFLLMNTGKEAILSKKGLISTVAWKINDEVKYALEGSIFVSGSLIQWLRDGLHLIKKASETEEMALSVKDNGGVVIVPAFTGLGAPYWKEDVQGAIFGLTRGVDTRHIVRAALEAMCYQSKDLIQLMEEEADTHIQTLKVDGGASMNKFLLQFQSDILNIPVTKQFISEATALGAARLAGLASGFYTMDDFKEADKEVYNPQMSLEDIEKFYSAWLKAVESCMHY